MIAQPREAVWDRIVDFGGLASWRRDVKRVERLPDRDGHEVWREGNLALETMALERPSRLVRRLAEPGAWGGEWAIVLREEGAGCRVTVTESGWVGNPLLRVISRYVIGQTRSIDGYLRSLERSFGEEVEVEDWG